MKRPDHVTHVHPRLIPCLLRPALVHNPNGISIGSAVFAGLTTVTDRQTDHATRSVTTGRIYVRSTAMRPKMKLSKQKTCAEHNGGTPAALAEAQLRLI